MKQIIFPLSIASFGIFLLVHHKQKSPPLKIHEVPSHQSFYYQVPIPSKNAMPTPPTSEPRNFATVKPTEKISYQKIKSLLTCLSSERCEFSQADPRSYEMELSQQILSELQKISQSPSGRNAEELEPLLKKTIAMDWAEIKIETLKILSQHPPNRHFVKPLLLHVVHQPQPDAIPFALRELARFEDPSDQKIIHRELQKALTKGSVFTAAEIAKEIGPHLSEEQRKHYWKIHEQLLKTPLSKEIAQNLEQSLKR